MVNSLYHVSARRHTELCAHLPATGTRDPSKSALAYIRRKLQLYRRTGSRAGRGEKRGGGL